MKWHGHPVALARPRAVVRPPTLAGLWDLPAAALDAGADIARGAVDLVHLIPGVDEAGELLKDFAKTAVGEWSLRVIASFGYYAIAPYVGAQLAAVAFAVPGLAKGDPFIQSWIKETTDRVVKTAAILAGQTDVNLGSKASAEIDRWLREHPEVQEKVRDLQRDAERVGGEMGRDFAARVESELQEGLTGALARTQAIAREYGVPPDLERLAQRFGSREDTVAGVFDLMTHNTALSNVRRTFDPLTGRELTPARDAQQRALMAERERLMANVRSAEEFIARWPEGEIRNGKGTPLARADGADEWLIKRAGQVRRATAEERARAAAVTAQVSSSVDAMRRVQAAARDAAVTSRVRAAVDAQRKVQELSPATQIVRATGQDLDRATGGGSDGTTIAIGVGAVAVLAGFLYWRAK